MLRSRQHQSINPELVSAGGHCGMTSTAGFAKSCSLLPGAFAVSPATWKVKP